MKNTLFVIMFNVLAWIFCVQNAWADDYQKYYQYMSDQRVEVKKDHITFSFRWKQDMGSIFKPGDEFELGVMIDPKYFAKPFSGADSKLGYDFNTNIPCGTRDVYNYTRPASDTEVYNNVWQWCSGSIQTQTQDDFLREVSWYYQYGKIDDAGNFTMVTTCPEALTKNAPDGGPWKFTYFLKPVPASEVMKYTQENACGVNGYYPDWGFFWITAKVQPDTLVKKDSPSVKIADCPYLLGLPAFDYWLWKNPYLPNVGKTTVLFNRGCAPTDTVSWGFSDPRGNNWHNLSGQKFFCRDCDGDGFYDSDFPAKLYGTQTGDCNDANEEIHPGADEIVGDGVDSNCDGCVDSICFAGPANPCAYDTDCNTGSQVQMLCPDGIHFSKKVCNDQCQWDVISTCPADPSCGGFCSDGTVCNPTSGQCELDPNMGTGGSGNSGGSNGSGGQNTSDPCGGPCPSGTSCNVTLGVCMNTSSGGAGGNSGTSSGGNAGTSGSGIGGSANSGGNTGSGGSSPVPCGGFCGADTYCNPVSNMCEQLNGGSGGSGSSGSGGSSSSGGNTGSGGSSSCSCSSGICCDGCNFLGTSSVCDGYFTYRCEGNGLGQDGQQAVVNTYCSGFSANCNGATTQSSWMQYQDCSPSQQCQMSGSVPVCVAVQPCSDVYLFDGTYACMTNSGKIGAPTICLEVQQQNGSLWQYRACRQGGNFANDFTIRLLDQNHLPHNLGGPYANTKGNACSQWHDFDVSYLNGYGAVNGAGLVAEILSPASCAQSSCTYQTGIITIRRECQ